MKKTLLGAVAALALVAPGVASAQSGHVGVSYATNDDADFETTAVSGSFGGANFQLDGRYGSAEGDVDVWEIGGHLFQRSDTMLWGGYAGYSTWDSGVAGLDIDEWTIAGEMQFYVDRTTFTGALSYTDATLIGVDAEQWGLEGEVRHFVTDNFSFQGNVGFANAEAGGIDTDITSYGVGAEWQLSTMPISFVGGWQGSDSDLAEPSVLSFGVRYNWGGTLLERNRSGAGLSRPQGLLQHAFGEIAPR